MARDYAKARSKKKPSSQPSGNGSGNSKTSRLPSGILWLFIGLMLGLLIPGFDYIKQHVTSLIQGKKQNKHDTLLRDPIPQKVKPGQHDEIEELEQRTAPTPTEENKPKIWRRVVQKRGYP